jgi:alkaline phosphatase
MKKIIKLSLLLIFGVSWISCFPTEKSKHRRSPEIRNIILMIGDGMGLSTVNAAMTVSDHPLNIERCQNVGLQKTFSADDYITDSAASGTAIATGNKTNNGVLGLDSLGIRVKTILEIAEENGLSTGLVSSSSITHATPAAFIAHQAGRDNYEDIALDFLRTDIDVFIGGGIEHFAKRSDNLNLLDSLKLRGYEVDTTMSAILGSTSRKLAGLTAQVHNPFRLMGRGDMLPAASQKAIEILSKNKKGFFLMIEGSQIDWAGHSNNADALVDETLDFDDAIGKALDFAQKDGHTLVIITADHETGGVTIVDGDIHLHQVKLDFSTTSHTAVMVPVYAFGPGADIFSGIYDNTGIFYKILSSYGFDKSKQR